MPFPGLQQQAPVDPKGALPLYAMVPPDVTSVWRLAFRPVPCCLPPCLSPVQRIYSHEVPSCPICLYPPLAAHITRCGHIFCWSCMLHYLSLSDKSWSKCPICYEAVHGGDLKRSAGRPPLSSARSSVVLLAVLF